MGKHTPGPWKNKEICICGQRESGLDISFLSTSNEERIIEGLANAKLIVAAPDLLAILEEIVAQYADFPEEVIEEIAPDWYPKATEILKRIKVR